MALLPLMCRHLCHHCNCDCHPHDNGIVAIVNAQGSLQSSRSMVALVTMALLPLIHNGVVARIVMVSSPSSSWRCCPCCNDINIIINVVALVACCQAGIVAIDVQASLLLLQWQLSLLSQWHHHHCQCKGISAVVKLALLPLLLVIKLASLPLLQWHCCR
jgi:hypothetical protein